MEKELQNLLDNYEKVIYGQAFPISPTIHQIHLLLDYIANQGVQLKKQQEIIDKATEELKQGITFCKNDSQGSYDICNMAINREKKILEILEDKGN